jgi:TetR/AcrR family transcriptional regulator, transcriptional repressor of aconitase
MPKLTEAQWRAQETRFLDAVRRCCTRVGLDNASVQEIRREAGASAGAMYRYFPSKDDMVRAAIAGSMSEVETLIVGVANGDEATTQLTFLRSLLTYLQEFRYHIDGVDLFRLAIQGWSHAQSRPKTLAVITESFQRQLDGYQQAARRWVSVENSEVVARALAGAIIGYVVQSAFSDADIDPLSYCAGFGQWDAIP